VIVFLNGAFGIGKTTVARLLRNRLPGSAIFDPELLGIVLQRLPSWLPGSGRGADDFQDLLLWRRGNLRALRVARAFRRALIVPMAFLNLDTLREFLDGAERIEQRAARSGAVGRSWQLRGTRGARVRRARRDGASDARGHRARDCAEDLLVTLICAPRRRRTIAEPAPLG